MFKENVSNKVSVYSAEILTRQLRQIFPAHWPCRKVALQNHCVMHNFSKVLDWYVPSRYRRSFPHYHQFVPIHFEFLLQKCCFLLNRKIHLASEHISISLQWIIIWRIQNLPPPSLCGFKTNLCGFSIAILTVSSPSSPWQFKGSLLLLKWDTTDTFQQDSPPAWTQEVYRPCLTTVLALSREGGGYPILARAGRRRGREGTPDLGEGEGREEYHWLSLG